MTEDGIGCLFTIIVAVVVFEACAWITQLIVNSDMPTWLKIMLLR